MRPFSVVALTVRKRPVGTPQHPVHPSKRQFRTATRGKPRWSQAPPLPSARIRAPKVSTAREHPRATPLDNEQQNSAFAAATRLAEMRHIHRRSSLRREFGGCGASPRNPPVARRLQRFEPSQQPASQAVRAHGSGSEEAYWAAFACASPNACSRCHASTIRRTRTLQSGAMCRQTLATERRSILSIMDDTSRTRTGIDRRP